MALLYTVSGELTEVKPKNPETGFGLDELYEIIDCELIQVVPLRTGDLLVCDEEGKLNGSEANKKATQEYGSQVFGGTLEGNVLICTDQELQ